MGNPIDGQRKMKDNYAKRTAQAPYANVAQSVDPNPPPQSSYSTTTHVATSPVKPGLVPRPAVREVKSLIGTTGSFRAYNQTVYPWHLVPKSNSSNIIQRSLIDAGTIGATGTLGQSVDIINLFVADNGGNTQVSQNAGAPQATPANLTNEYWSISKFGHAELLDSATNADVTYQIIIDGEIELEWTNFQLSPTTPNNQMWEFENPLVVNSQLIFRVLYAGADYDFSVAGQEVDTMFVGWTEQYVYGADDRSTNIDPV